jgi:hypothetical protein
LGDVATGLGPVGFETEKQQFLLVFDLSAELASSCGEPKVCSAAASFVAGFSFAATLFCHILHTPASSVSCLG